MRNRMRASARQHRWHHWDRIRKSGVGDVLILRPETYEEIIGDVVLRARADNKGEVKILTEAARLRIRIGKKEPDPSFDIGNDLPAWLHKVVTRSDDQAFVMSLRPPYN